jgi:hypothetical protein
VLFVADGLLLKVGLQIVLGSQLAYMFNFTASLSFAANRPQSPRRSPRSLNRHSRKPGPGRFQDRQRIDFYWKYAQLTGFDLSGFSRYTRYVAQCGSVGQRARAVNSDRCRSQVAAAAAPITRMRFTEKSIKVEPKWVRWVAATMTLEVCLLLPAALGE